MSKNEQQDFPRNPMQVKPPEQGPMTAAQREADKAIKLAQQAQAMRKKAPVATGGQNDCKATQIIDRIAAKYGGQLAEDGCFWYFDDHKSVTENALKGGEPYIEDGEYIRNESDILFKAPTWLYKKNRNDEMAQSDAPIRDVIENDKNMRPEERQYNRTVIAKPGTPQYEQALAGANDS